MASTRFITVPAPTVARPSFIISGGAEAPEGQGGYGDLIVRRGDVSAGALREKARYVVAKMRERVRALGFDFKDLTDTQMYTVHDVHPFVQA